MNFEGLLELTFVEVNEIKLVTRINRKVVQGLGFRDKG